MPRSKRAITYEDRMQDMVNATPRQRVSFNRSTPLVMTGSWQTLPLASGNSQYDTNSFPNNRFDNATNRMLANPENNFEQGYILQLDMAIKPNVAGYVIKPMIRFVVPSPTPIYFPMPDSLMKLDLGYELTGTDPTVVSFTYPVYTNAAIRQYGARIEVNYVAHRQNANLVSSVVNTVTQVLTGSQRPQINDATLNMYSI